MIFLLCLRGFWRSVVLPHPRREEADDPELIVGQGDHAGRIVVMRLPVDVFQKLEDPPESRAIRHSPQLVGEPLFEGGESLPETFLGQSIDQEGHRHDGDERHDPGLLFEEEAFRIETRILEETIAPLDRRSLGLVGGDQGTGRERRVVDIVGGQHEEALFAEDCRDLLRVFPERRRTP